MGLRRGRGRGRGSVKGKGNERWKKEEKTAKSKTVFKIFPPPSHTHTMGNSNILR
jgi:hypothetical protein